MSKADLFASISDGAEDRHHLHVWVGIALPGHVYSATGRGRYSVTVVDHNDTEASHRAPRVPNQGRAGRRVPTTGEATRGAMIRGVEVRGEKAPGQLLRWAVVDRSKGCLQLTRRQLRDLPDSRHGTRLTSSRRPASRAPALDSFSGR